MIEIQKFSLQRNMIPHSLYGGKPYYAGSTGVVISRDVRDELQRFLGAFLGFCGYGTKGVYLRLDAFLDPLHDQLYILEINARFVDGWGTALNLNRAAGIRVELADVYFPSLWHLPVTSSKYRREFLLVLHELQYRYRSVREIGEAALGRYEVYYYGWGRRFRDERTMIVPAHGYEIEDKLKLAQFSWEWDGCHVKVPGICFYPAWEWDDVIGEHCGKMILKFTEKGSLEARRAGASVLYSVDRHNERFLRDCYRSGVLVAQEVVETRIIDGKMSQVVILACGSIPVTGYILLAPQHTRSINDCFLHGPLRFE